ncbi:MAG: ATP synthase F1 subunit epsilon [Planctomycetota bacterium]
MAGSLTLRVITPEHIALDTTCSSVSFPTIDGSVGILKDHAPMVAAIGAGELTFRDEGSQPQGLFVAGGFAEVRSNTVRLVTDVSEAPTDIDVERAKRAAERAMKRLEMQQSEGDALDLLRAQAALQRAIMRQQVASKYR